MKKIFQKIKGNAKLFYLKNKTVIKFECSGCMAHIHDFKWIGEIVDFNYPRLADGEMFYKVKVFKDNNGYELRSLKEGEEIRFENIPSWYLQKISNDLYFIYD